MEEASHNPNLAILSTNKRIENMREENSFKALLFNEEKQRSLRNYIAKSFASSGNKRTGMPAVSRVGQLDVHE